MPSFSITAKVTPSTQSIVSEPRLTIPDASSIVYLKERTLNMLKNDLIQRNPLRFLNERNENALDVGEFGGILARAGVGKTALIVQLAMNAMLKGHRVLHISLTDPVNKVNLWYQEVYRHLTHGDDAAQARTLWEQLLPYRFIMTFKAEGFRLPVLAERLGDLREQNIFTPTVIIMDGYPFEEAGHENLAALKAFSKGSGMRVWFTVRTHRHETSDEIGLPAQLSNLNELFDVLVQLQPDGKVINIEVLKGMDAAATPSTLVLDPTTMLIVDGRQL
ncbi:MAG: cytoplasmic protein [Pseudomonadota bacterium]